MFGRRHGRFPQSGQKWPAPLGWRLSLRAAVKELQKGGLVNREKGFAISATYLGKGMDWQPPGKEAEGGWRVDA